MANEKQERYYTYKEYREKVFPISIEDLLEIEDPHEFGIRLTKESINKYFMT